MGIIIPKFEKWEFANVHKELQANNKQFGLVYSQCFEWGMGFPSLYAADAMQEIRDKIMELTNGKYSWFLTTGEGMTSDDFHSMNFQIYKSHHCKFYETVRTETGKAQGQS
jgi:hypothetical protein